MWEDEINVYRMIDWYLVEHTDTECKIVSALQTLYDRHIKEFTFDEIVDTAGIKVETDEERKEVIDLLKRLSKMDIFINFCGLTPALMKYGFIVNRKFFDMKVDDAGNGVFTGHIAPEVAEIVASMFLDGWTIEQVRSYMSKNGMN